MADDYVPLRDPLGENPNPVDPNQDTTWEDYGRAALGTVYDIGAGAMAGSRYLNEVTGNEEGAEASAIYQKKANRAANQTREGMTPAAQRASESSVLSGDFWEHPFRAVALKGTAMSPYFVAAALPGGIVGEALGAGAGLTAAAATNIALGVDDFINAVDQKIDGANDKTLQDQSDYYAGLRARMGEKEARAEFKDYMLNGDGRLALTALVSGITGFAGPEAMVARMSAGKGALLTGAKETLAKRAGAGFAEGALGEGVEQGGQSYTQQEAEIAGGFQNEFDFKRWTSETLEAMGLAGLVSGAVGGLAGGEKSSNPKLDTSGGKATVESVNELAPDAAQTAAAQNEEETAPAAAPKAEAIKQTSRARAAAEELSPDLIEALGVQEADLGIIRNSRIYGEQENVTDWPENDPESSFGLNAPRVPRQQPVEDIFPGDLPSRRTSGPMDLADVFEEPSAPRSRARQSIDDLDRIARNKETLPESQDTLDAQREQLTKGERDAMLYTPGEVIPPLDQGFAEHTNESGTWHYNPKEVTPQELDQAAQIGRENDLLDLGPFNKQDVAKSLARGSEPVAVVARTADGTESRAAAATRELAPKTAEVMARTAKSNETQLNFETPEQALGERVKNVAKERGKGKKQAQVAQAEPDIFTAPVSQAAPENTESQPVVTREVTETNALGEPMTRTVLMQGKDVVGEVRDGKRILFNKDQIAAERRSEFERKVAEKKAAKEYERKAIADDKRKEKTEPKKAEKKSDVDKALKRKGFKDDEIAKMDEELKQLIADQDKDIAMIPASGDVEAGERMQMEARTGAPISSKMGMRTANEATKDSGRKVAVNEKATKAAEISARRAAEREKMQEAARQAAKGKQEAETKLPPKKPVALPENTLFTEKTKRAVEAQNNKAEAQIAEGFFGLGRKKAEEKTRVEPTLEEPKVRMEGLDLENAIDGKTPEEVAAYIAKNTSNKFYTQIANRVVERINALKNVGGTFRFTIVHPGMKLPAQVANRLTRASGLAYYQFKGGDPHMHVYLNGTEYEVQGNHGTKEEVVLHELVHAVTMQTMRLGRENPGTELHQHYRELADIFNQVVRHFNERATKDKANLTEFEKEIYQRMNNALGDPDELIAWSLTNKEMQDYLKTIPVKGNTNAFSAFVQKLMEILGLRPEDRNALIEILRVTDDMMSVDPTAIRSQADLSGESFYVGPKGKELLSKVSDRASDAGTDASSFGRMVQRATDTMAMIARRAGKYGEKFGELARNVDLLVQKMDRTRSRLLEREGGGFDIVREGDELSRKHGETFTKAVDIMFRASELNVNLSKQGTVADNKHLGFDSVRGWQGKAQFDKLQNEFRSLPQDLQDWALKTVKFGRDEHNARMLETIKVILRAADINDDGLAQRIFENGVTDEDRARFKTNKIVEHLDRVSDFKQLQGWYVPFKRQGDYVVAAEMPVKAPSGVGVTKVSDNTFIFTDPRGKGSDTRARDAARAYVGPNDVNKGSINRIWVDKNDPSQILAPEELNAIPAYRVEMQNRNVEFFESESEARNRAEELKGMGYNNVYTDLQKQNPNARWGGLLPSQYETVIRSLTQKDSFKSLSSEQKDLVVQAMREANVRLLPGTRIQKSGLERKNVAGYSRDLLQSMAAYAEESANYRARLQYQPDVDANLQAMSDYIDTKRDDRSIQRREILREFENRIQKVGQSEPNTFLATASRRLRQVSMLDKLAGPSFHIINSMEPWTTSLPYIGGRHGAFDTLRTLKAAYNLIGARGGVAAGLKDTVRAFAQDTGFTNYLDMFKAEIAKNAEGNRAKRLASVLDYLDEVNLFNNEAGMEMSRIARPTGNLLSRGLDRADVMARQVGQTIEAINRATTGLTAYELEFKRTGDHQKALEYARDTVDITMGNYAASNASPIFNNAIGAAALQFKKFAQKTYYLLGKVMGEAIKGNPEAQKQFVGLMLTHATIAGALGLPLEPIKVALLTANALGMTAFTYNDFEELAREAAAKALGVKGGEILTRGLPRAVGIDVSGRVSMADLLTFSTPRSQKAEDMKTWIFDVAAGAPAGLIIQQIEGAQALFGGDLQKFAEKSIPIKAARDINQAVTRTLSPQKNEFGKETVPAYSPVETVTRALGFRPAREAEIGEMRRQVGRQTFEYTQKRAQLIRDWASASEGNRAKQMIAIEKFNRDLPGDAKISREDLQKALKQRKTESNKGTVVQGLRFNKRTDFLKNQMGIFNTR